MGLRRSHFIIHGVKTREHMLSVHDYFMAREALGSGSTQELRRCLHHHSPESVMRLRFNVGYERTHHFADHAGEPYNATSATWSTFEMADCAEQQSAQEGGCVSIMPGIDATWCVSTCATGSCPENMCKNCN